MVASTKRAANPFAHASIPYLLMLESGEAELAKLASNAFLAAKVAFFNEVACLAGRLGLEYEKVREAITCDQRIGASHSMVPGHDGDRGFGGSCLPKDTSGLLDVMRRHGTPSAVVQSASASAGMSSPLTVAVTLIVTPVAFALIGNVLSANVPDIEVSIVNPDKAPVAVGYLCVKWV